MAPVSQRHDTEQEIDPMSVDAMNGSLSVDECTWRSVVSSVLGVRLQSSGRNTPVTIDEVPSPLRLVGFGTDAVAVQHPLVQEVIFKVYAPGKLRCLEDELQSYRLLAHSPFFPRCFGRGPSYLILSYEPGPTLLECLLQGIPIPEAVIDDVEAARRQARDVGLYPKDIHLKNVLLQPSGAKVLDLSRYVTPGDDTLWDHLALGYRRFYPLMSGRPIPLPLIELIKEKYRARDQQDPSIEAFLAHLVGD